MENHKSWINNYSKFDLSELSQKLINNIIISLNNKNLIKADDFEFSNKEIDLIYRWSLYVSSSTFLERLIKIINKKIFKKNKIKKNINYFYNLNSLDFSYNYYNNSDLNARLINDIIGIFSSENIEIKPDSINTQKNKNFFFQKNYTINGLKNFIKRNYYKLNFLTKSEKYIYENCIWLNAIFKKKQIIKDIGSNEYEINKKFRSQLRECFKKEFIKTLNNKIFHEIKLSEQTKNNLSKLFSFWVDCSIPKSLIEGINFKLNFYKKYIQNKKIKFVHVCTGIYANDNIKLLCLLCKRNKIKIIGHDHGINNFVSFYNKENNKLNFYKGLFQFYYEDIFFSWGAKKLDIWDQVETKTNIKIFNIGSVYLNNLGKYKKTKVNHDIFTILYPECPSRKFMANLEEITTEENSIHKENVIKFFKLLLIKNKKINIIYKNFDGNYHDDYFKLSFQREIQNKSVIISNIKPTELMHTVDLVLFDMLSTGFAESICSEVPSIIFSNTHDYELASNDGKLINDLLYKNKLLFYKISDGLDIILRFSENKLNYFESNKNLIDKFKKNICYPVSKKKFLFKMNKILLNE